MPRTITCPACGEVKPHSARGLCKPCYQRQYYPRYYQEHRENIESYKRSWEQANASKQKDRLAALYLRRNEEIKERSAAWKIANRDRVRVHYQTREARKRSLPATLTAEQWQAIKDQYGYRCAYCGRKNVKLTQDHVIPISKGGGTTIQNVVPACQSCNTRKKDGPPLKPVQPLLL